MQVWEFLTPGRHGAALGGSEPPRRWIFRRQCTADLLGQLRGKNWIPFTKHNFLRTCKHAALGGCEVRLHRPCVCTRVPVCLRRFRASGLSPAVRRMQLQGSEPMAERR